MILPEALRSLPRAKLDALAKIGKVVGPLPTRRIYFLAVNLRNPVFAESDNLRRALAYAIPRQEILKTVFSGLKGDKPLKGPYPTGSWACDEKVPDLDKPPSAKQLIGEPEVHAKLNNVAQLRLIYPNDDKAAEEAMKTIALHLDKTGVKIELVAVDPHDLRERVEDTHAYDLAYYHYDFPSEAYWLWPLFHPKGTYLGSQVAEDAVLSSLFLKAMARRDPAEVQNLTHLIHNHINAKMYIIPLWQLGAYYAIREGIETESIDPLRTLADVHKWQKRER